MLYRFKENKNGDYVLFLDYDLCEDPDEAYKMGSVDLFTVTCHNESGKYHLRQLLDLLNKNMTIPKKGKLIREGR